MAGYLARVGAAIGNLARNQYDSLALASMRPLYTSFLPWSGAAMRPAGLLAVLNDVVVNRRRHVLECGSGLSTIMIARLLSRQGGRLTSIEHDAAWLDRVDAWLVEEGLREHVDLCHAPLVDVDRPGVSGRWYDPAPIASVLDASPDRMDLLLVDGPPAGTAATADARYPALPVLGPALADSCTIVLDDANRRGEREVLKRWESETGLKFEIRRLAGCVAIARRGASYQA